MELPIEDEEEEVKTIEIGIKHIKREGDWYSCFEEELVCWNPNDNISIEMLRQGIVGDENRKIKVGDIVYVDNFAGKIIGSKKKI